VWREEEEDEEGIIKEGKKYHLLVFIKPL